MLDEEVRHYVVSLDGLRKCLSLIHIFSPIFSDPRGLPPTLFVTSGRDLLLSGTVNLHRAYVNAGVDARLVVFDALPLSLIHI